MTIRRAKKRTYIHNDSRIKTCLRRFDDNSYSRIQFLRAVSHSVGAHGPKLCDAHTDSDSDTSADDADASTSAVVATSHRRQRLRSLPHRTARWADRACAMCALSMCYVLWSIIIFLCLKDTLCLYLSVRLRLIQLWSLCRNKLNFCFTKLVISVFHS